MHAALERHVLPTFKDLKLEDITGGSVPTDSNNYVQGATVTVLGSGTLVKTANTFSGWNTQANGSGTTYTQGQTFSITSNVTLYAVWIPSNLTFTISGTSITITGYTTAPSGSLTIPGGVTNIANDVFKNCSALTSVSFPSSFTTIGNDAFKNCSSPTSVIVQASTPPALGNNIFQGCAGGLQIHVPLGTLSTYTSAPGWIAYASQIVSP